MLQLDLLDLLRIRNSFSIRRFLPSSVAFRDVKHLTFSQLHLVISGSLLLEKPGLEELCVLAPGDVVFFPQGLTQDKFDCERDYSNADSSILALKEEVEPEKSKMSIGETLVISIYFQISEQTPNSIILPLPKALAWQYHEQLETIGLDAFRKCMIDIISEPLGISQTLLNRLTETMCIYLIQNWLKEVSPESPRFEGLNGPKIKLVLDAIHKDPIFPWTVEKLSEIYGDSTTTFATHFGISTDRSPMRYVREYRISQACRLLAAGNYSIEEVARLSGYQDTNAFNRAFKRAMGSPPRAYSQTNMPAKSRLPNI